jgi:FkbM family methyltransferase
MKAYGGWQFPDEETHLLAQLARWHHVIDGRLTYQYPIYATALTQCGARRGTAVDVGAHVGLWSFWMARDFAQVIAFEPVAAHRQCWVANMPPRPHDVLYPVALGAEAGSVALVTARPSSTGGTVIDGAGAIPLRTLDSFALDRVDLLKIDCEGTEGDVLRGAVATLTRCRPVVAVEQRPKLLNRLTAAPRAALDLLESLGAAVVWTDAHDFVLRFG